MTVGLAVLGVDPLSVVLGVPQVTVDNLVVHRDHRRCGAGAAGGPSWCRVVRRCAVVHRPGWCRCSTLRRGEGPSCLAPP
ncbi:MAG TPA: hypothetical protein VK365_05265 [Nocardioidaceae bacterium]|nr:hypothetical protein [Nocardioidaceae bacterium]